MSPFTYLAVLFVAQLSGNFGQTSISQCGCGVALFDANITASLGIVSLDML